MGMSLAVISSLGAPLVPQMAHSYGVSLSDAQWSLTVTLLAGTVATPVFGRLGDGPHRRTASLVAVGCAVLGCVLAALPLDFLALLLGRALQGIGVGLVPLAIATAHDHLPGERGAHAVGMLSITTAAGVGLGYPLTGLVAQWLGLHGAFWFGAVISALALLTGLRVLPSSAGLPSRGMDPIGAVLLGLGLAGVLLVLSEGDTWGWTSRRLLALAVGSVLVLAVWVWVELRLPRPLVDLRVARHRPVLAANTVIVVLGIGMYLLLSLVTRLAQTPTDTGYGFGASIAVTGLALLPFSVMSVAANQAEHALARRMSPQGVLLLSCLVFLASMVWFTLRHGALWDLFVAMGICGLGIGCGFAVIPQLVVDAVPGTETGSAISLNQVLRCVGYATGSALSATVLAARTPAGDLLPTADGYTLAGVFGIVSGVATVLVTVVLAPRTRPGPPSPERRAAATKSYRGH
ncbi:MFS transporter [Kitasatospora sp. NPDC089509]|uniref:MFS transporter n=1 Tax=Kitasatospora sp. NPDC089509 TaxID=3364079 RepID=UPI00380F4328